MAKGKLDVMASYVGGPERTVVAIIDGVPHRYKGVGRSGYEEVEYMLRKGRNEQAVKWLERFSLRGGGSGGERIQGSEKTQRKPDKGDSQMTIPFVEKEMARIGEALGSLDEQFKGLISKAIERSVVGSIEEGEDNGEVSSTLVNDAIYAMTRGRTLNNVVDNNLQARLNVSGDGKIEVEDVVGSITVLVEIPRDVVETGCSCSESGMERAIRAIDLNDSDYERLLWPSLKLEPGVINGMDHSVPGEVRWHTSGVKVEDKDDSRIVAMRIECEVVG